MGRLRRTLEARTSDGVIPYLRHPCGLMLPPKLVWHSDPNKLPTPVRSNGQLVYVLPGNVDYVEPTDEDIAREMRQRPW